MSDWESVGDWRLKLSSDKIKIKPSVANLCTSTTLYRKGFSKQKFDITIYNIQQLICHNQGGENIHWNAQGFFFLRFFFFFFRVSFFSFFPSHTKKGGKALLHYKGLQMYNYTVRSMWSLLGYIIDTDSTSKTRKTTKFYIYIYIYMQRSTPSIHVIFIEARPENESPMLNDLSAG